jgi:hypothetical protein
MKEVRMNMKNDKILIAKTININRIITKSMNNNKIVSWGLCVKNSQITVITYSMYVMFNVKGGEKE